MFSFEIVCARKKRTRKKKKKKSTWVNTITHKKYIQKKHSLISQLYMIITLIQKI